MNLSELNHAIRHKKPRRRVGRGHGSGWGRTAGRGENGARSRSGFKQKNNFEGGQMPLTRRIPKRGFTNAPFRQTLAVVNLKDLDVFDAETTVTLQLLLERGIIHGAEDGVKLLGVGIIEKPLLVQVHRVSAGAKQAIESAGGTVELLPLPGDVAAKKWRAKRNKGKKISKTLIMKARAKAKAKKK
jgi:large subunit ribosomal protein L15